MAELDTKIPAGVAAKALGHLAREQLGGQRHEAQLLAGRDRFVARLDAAERPAASPRRSALWLLAAAALGAMLLGGVPLLVRLVWPSTITYVVAGSVLSADGQVRAQGQPAHLVFSDGSVVTLEPGASGRVLESGAHGARILAQGGRLEARIVHREGAHWAVDTGPYRVRVTGTEFSADWNPTSSRLAVELRSGRVTVQGPSIEAGISLSPGQRLVAQGSDVSVSSLPAAPSNTSESAAPSSVASGTDLTPALAVEPMPVSGAGGDAGTPSWRGRVASGDFAGVLVEAESQGLERVMRERPLDDLLALADAARYSGRGDIAEKTLRAERERFSGTAAARTAAFLLGRIAEGRGASGEAVQWYQRYRAESPSGALAEESLGREMLVVHRLGQRERARELAREYGNRYPKGAFSKAARGIVGE